MSWQALLNKGWWVIHHPFERQDPRYWRIRLMQSLLLILQLYSGIFVILNLTLFGYYTVAVANLAVFAVILGIQTDLRRNLNLERSANWLTGTIIVFMVIYVALTQGRNYAFIWLSMVPTIAFFLLGIRRGLKVTVPFLLLTIGYIVWSANAWPSYAINLPAFFNISCALFAVLTIARHYEKSRAEAYACLEERNAELQRIAITDGLTQLHNRSHLDAVLDSEVQRAQRHNTELSVLILDTDHFKVLNDSYGHLVGDQVLIELSELLREKIRATDILGRWGGEEFMIIAPNTDAEGAVELAEKIRVATAKHRFTDEHLHLTISVGVAEFNQQDTLISIVRRADEGLYQAKHDGRDCTRLGKTYTKV